MLRTSHLLLAAAAALLGLGVIMIQSASMSPGMGQVVESWQLSGEPPHPETLGGILPDRAIWQPFFTDWNTAKNIVYAALALVTLFVVSRLNIRRMLGVGSLLRNPGVWLMVVAWLLCLALLVPGVSHVIGHGLNEKMGANRWVGLGPFSFQPSELLKWSMLPVLALVLARREQEINRFPVLCMMLGLMCLVSGIIVKEDLGTAALCGMVGMALLLIAGVRMWIMSGLSLLGIAAVTAMILVEPYRRARIMAFTDPFKDPEGVGYHSIQSLLAFAHGGIHGRGLGLGLEKYVLPEDTSDFIFPIICEELGLVGACLVVGLILAVVWCGVRIACDCKDAFGRYLALGVTLTFGFQAAINIAVVTCVMPTKGIALPLVSQGGTGWVMTAYALGFLASLDIQNNCGVRASNVTSRPAEAPSA